MARRSRNQIPLKKGGKGVVKNLLKSAYRLDTFFYMFIIAYLRSEISHSHIHHFKSDISSSFIPYLNFPLP